jgi:hypothetical protein
MDRKIGELSRLSRSILAIRRRSRQNGLDRATPAKSRKSVAARVYGRRRLVALSVERSNGYL